MEVLSNHHCFICGMKFREDVSKINSRKQICLKFSALVSRYLNSQSQSSINLSAVNLTSDTASNIIRNTFERHNNKNEESVCCSNCVSEVESFCNSFKTGECLQLEMFRILGRIPNFAVPTPTISWNELISKVEEKRRRHYPYLRLDKLKQSKRQKEMNFRAALTKSEVVSDNGQQYDSDTFIDFSNSSKSIQDSIAIENHQSCNNVDDDAKDSEEPDVMVKVEDDAVSVDAKQYEDYGMSKIECDVVKTKSVRKRKRKRVRRQSPPDNMNDRICLFCDKICQRPYELVHHMRVHTRETPYFCRTCQTEFTKIQSIQQHLKRKHGNAPPVMCDICGNVVKDIRQHLSRVHGPNRLFCSICGKGYAGPAALRNHMPFHTKEENLSCHICEAKFKFASQLSRHKIKEHSDFKGVQCDICGKVVINIHSHRRVHKK